MKRNFIATAGVIALSGAMVIAHAEERKRPPRKGPFNTRPARGERSRDKLKVGDKAPDFTLPDITGKKKITLSGFRGKKPVVLVFASCT